MAHNRFAKMPIQSYVADKPKELPPLMIKSSGIELRPGKQDTRERKVILTNSDIQSIITRHIQNRSVNSIAKEFNCTFTRIKDILSKNSDKIEQYRNQLGIELDRQFKHSVIAKRSEIIEKITEKDIESATLGMKTGSIMDLTKIKALEEGRNVDGSTINLNISTKSELIDFITRPNIKDNNIIEDEGVVDNNITTGK